MEANDDLVERVARAMFFESSGNDEINEDGEDVWAAIGTKAEYWHDLARAALAAIPDGREAALEEAAKGADEGELL